MLDGRAGRAASPVRRWLDGRRMTHLDDASTSRRLGSVLEPVKAVREGDGARVEATRRLGEGATGWWVRC
jgi:hypothetical protein